MTSLKTFGVFSLLLAILAVSLGLSFPLQETGKSIPAKPTPGNEAPGNEAQKDDLKEDQFAPIEDMHHFMEYVCEPSYKGLKQILTAEPENRQAWKAFKNHALVLAETSALVATRGPDDPEKAKQWRQISLDVYTSGAALYKSSGKFEEAKEHYELMIDHCNKCHTVFAEGKHQLKKFD